MQQKQTDDYDSNCPPSDPTQQKTDYRPINQRNRQQRKPPKNACPGAVPHSRINQSEKCQNHTVNQSSAKTEDMFTVRHTTILPAYDRINTSEYLRITAPVSKSNKVIIPFTS